MTRLKQTLLVGTDQRQQADASDMIHSVWEVIEYASSLVTLQPGEKRTVEFTLGPQHLGFYNREMKFVVEPGEFRVMVGANSQDVIEKSFAVN